MLSTGEDNASEGKVVLRGLAIENRCIRSHRVEAEVIAENSRRGRREDLGEALKELGLADNQLLNDGGLHALQDGGPTHSRGECIDLGQGHQVVILLGILQLLERTRHFRESGLQR